MDTASGQTRIAPSALLPKPDELLPVVPCNETFRHPHSRGTKLYRKTPNPTKFQGCQKLEAGLLGEKLVRHEFKEVLGAQGDYIVLIGETDAYLDEEGQCLDLDDDRIIHEDPNARSSRSDSLSEDLDADAEEPDRVKSYGEPWVDWLSQHPDAVSLTYKQRSAVQLLYFENHDGLKVGEVARKLRISVDSLKDRLAQAKKKVLAKAPELKGLARPKRPKKVKYESDLAFGGFYRKSLAKPAPLYRLNPENFAERHQIDPAPKRTKRESSKANRDKLAILKERERLSNYYPSHNGVFCADVWPWVRGPSKTESGRRPVVDESPEENDFVERRDSSLSLSRFEGANAVTSNPPWASNMVMPPKSSALRGAGAESGAKDALR